MANNPLIKQLQQYQLTFLNGLNNINFIAPLALRIYLFFPFFMAGGTKLGLFSDQSFLEKLQVEPSTIEWFANSDWGLGLPLPTLMAYLAAYTELVGAFLLLFGLATRLISIPLLITMLVAIFAVHWDNGWFAIAQSSDPGVAERLGIAREILQDNARNYDWLSEKGSFVILQNGIEFAVTYLIMLLALIAQGGGRFVSADYYIARYVNRTNSAQ